MAFGNEVQPVRLHLEVHQVTGGFWTWEVCDDDGPYLRSEDRFAFESEARADSDKSCHLIRAFLA